MSETVAPRSLRARLPALAARATGNTSVLLGSTVAQAVLRFGSNVVVTRFLVPDDFAVVLVISTLAYTISLLTDTGVAPFVVRSEKSVSKAALDTVWTVNVLRGLFIGTVLFLAAPLAADVFDDERLIGAVRVAAFLIALTEFRSMGFFVAMRRQDERRNALVRLGVYAAQLPVMIVGAWLIGNYWALILSIGATNLLTVIASYAFYGQRHRPRLDRTALGDLWRFSRLIAASSAVGLVVMQFDRYFLAAVAPKDVVGVYYLALMLVVTAEEMIHRWGRSVYMPVVSAQLRAGHHGPRTYYDPQRLVRPAILFLASMGVLLGPAFFTIVFPPEYAAGGAFLSLLSIRTVFAMLNQPSEAFLVADGGQRQVLISNAVRLGWTVIAGTAAFLYFGLYGLVLAICLRDVLPIIAQHAALARKGLFRSRRELPAVAAIGAGLLMGFAADQALRGLGLA